MPSSSYVQGDIIEVTCGTLTGKLHKNKFYCPGIHRECIEQLDGKFISPKMFTIMGEKERLKDWKNAVRIHGLQLRRYIDSGQLDFYRHDEYCTGRCVARTPISTTPGEKATASAFTRRRPLAMVPFIPPDFPAEKKLVRSPIPKVEFVGSINEHTYCHLPDDSERLAPGQDEPEDVKPDMTLLQNFIKRSSASFSKPSSETSTVTDKKDMTGAVEYRLLTPDQLNIPIEFAPVDGPDTQYRDDKNFWTGIMEFGFLDVFLVDIKENINILRKDMVSYGRPEDCYKLSVIVRVLGLMDKFKRKMATYKFSMEQQEAKLEKEMEELKSQVAIFERRKEALKKKSEKFKNLLEIGSVCKPETNSTPPESTSKISSVESSSPVAVVPKQKEVQPVVVKTNNEAETLQIIQTSPSKSLLKNKSLVKKVLLTSIPSEQSNDLKQVTVTIARLKECFENNRKVPIAHIIDTNSSIESTAKSLLEKSVYIPPQVSDSDNSKMDKECETKAVKEDSETKIDDVPASTSAAKSPSSSTTSPETSPTTSPQTSSTTSAEPSSTTSPESESEKSKSPSTDQLTAEKLDGKLSSDGKPRAKRLKLNSTIQVTNTAVKDKLRDRLKSGPTSNDESEGETAKQTESASEVVADDDDEDSANEPSDAKKRKTEDLAEENQRELVDKVTGIPYYGVKRKTVTEIIVSKAVAEKAKHILRGANEVLDRVPPKNSTDKKHSGKDKDTNAKIEKVIVKKSVEQGNEKEKVVQVKTEEGEVGTKTEISCQTPLDGVREKAIESQTIASRRSTRKTPHLFTWGSKVDVVKKIL